MIAVGEWDGKLAAEKGGGRVAWKEIGLASPLSADWMAYLEAVVMAEEMASE